ncbi:MmgE/PrpD family protein, partial [Thermodesulfobacteriota bacterium]
MGGEGFEIEKISFKPHACCRFNQTSIDAALELCSEHSIDYRNIQSVTLELTETGYYDVGHPPEVKFNPKNVVDGQFSAPYSVAIALLEGKAFLEEYSEEAIGRSDVRELMQKITVKHAPDLDKYFPEAWPARLTVRMRDGKQVVKEVKYAKGDPENPLSLEEIIDKFAMLVPHSLLGRDKQHQLIKRVLELEKIRDTNTFLAL